MPEPFILDKRYSTTRRIKNERPEVVAAELQAAHKHEDQFKTMLFLPEGESRQGEGGLRTRGYFKQSDLEKPIITIVTVVYNGAKFLEETILSVINQTYDNVEYIIIDGGSTDETIDIILKYEYVIDYWVSELDLGIYNAMNKGIILATGCIVGLVNADDVIYTRTLQHIATTLSENAKAEFTMMPVDLADEIGTIYGIAYPLTDEELALRMWKEMPSPHQGIYVRRNTYKMHGFFNERYRLRADYDLLLRLLKANVPYVRLNQPAGFFRSGGQSGGIATYLENRLLLAEYGRPRLDIELNFMASVAKMTAARVLPRFLFKKLKKLNVKSKRKLY